MRAPVVWAEIFQGPSTFKQPHGARHYKLPHQQAGIRQTHPAREKRPRTSKNQIGLATQGSFVKNGDDDDEHLQTAIFDPQAWPNLENKPALPNVSWQRLNGERVAPRRRFGVSGGGRGPGGWGSVGGEGAPRGGRVEGGKSHKRYSRRQACRVTEGRRGGSKEGEPPAPFASAFEK